MSMTDTILRWALTGLTVVATACSNDSGSDRAGEARADEQGEDAITVSLGDDGDGDAGVREDAAGADLPTGRDAQTDEGAEDTDQTTDAGADAPRETDATDVTHADDDGPDDLADTSEDLGVDSPDTPDAWDQPDAPDQSDLADQADLADEADLDPPRESQLAAVWVNNGQDKVARDERRASGAPESVHNSVWNGSSVHLFGARDEVVAFNIVLETPDHPVEAISLVFDRLDGPGDAEITSRRASADNDLFDYRGRNIELFFVRYLQIRGLSRLAYEYYDERHVPERLRRPFTGEGFGSGSWADRPDHDAFYPDIAVPIELEQPFDVGGARNQSIWVDVHIPRDAVAGLYRGAVEIREAGELTWRLPVDLEVLDFTLPATPSAATMLYLEYGDMNLRYVGEEWPNPGPLADRAIRVHDRHFQMAHRHRISLVNGNNSPSPWGRDAPVPEWLPRLDGSLFTASQGYDGPGEGVGNGVFAIGMYGGWSWRTEGESEMHAHTDAWANWFATNAPETDAFLYLIDESSDWAQIETWAKWMDNNEGPGGAIPSFATAPMPLALAHAPSLDIACSQIAQAVTSEWESAASSYRNDPDRRLCMYNGRRPASGSFATDDDGVALRMIPWAQFKHGVDRWFYWAGTYYDNFQGGGGRTNVFESAYTFGIDDHFDESIGRTGWNYTNGDGVLFYPGTDTVFPAESYGVDGPMASLRLKHWRRGIQDADYLALAAAIDGPATKAIEERIVPVVLWDVGVQTLDDPTWVRRDISWSTDPDVWEAARRDLADIILGDR